MSRIRASLIVVFAVCLAPAVRADIRTPQNDSSVGSANAARVILAPSINAVDLQAYQAIQVADFSIGFAGEVSLDVEAAPIRRDVIQLPPPPSSSALFLSAMVSVGAWQLVRTGRDLHLSALPEWYHTGGPTQVGHVTVFDLDFTSLPLCLFVEPVGEPLVVFHTARDLRLRPESCRFLSVADPRGPPALSV